MPCHCKIILCIPNMRIEIKGSDHRDKMPLARMYGIIFKGAMTNVLRRGVVSEMFLLLCQKRKINKEINIIHLTDETKSYIPIYNL